METTEAYVLDTVSNLTGPLSYGERAEIHAAMAGLLGSQPAHTVTWEQLEERVTSARVKDAIATIRSDLTAHAPAGGIPPEEIQSIQSEEIQ